MRGAQSLRSEVYMKILRNDKGCCATKQMDFLQSLYHLVCRYLPIVIISASFVPS